MKLATQERIKGRAREIMEVAARHRVGAKYADLKAVAAEMGVSPHTVVSYVAEMKRMGWPLKFTARPERFAPKPPVPRAERPLNFVERATLRKAEILADAKGLVDLNRMAEAFGVTPNAIQRRITKLKGRGWRWTLANTYRTPKPKAEPEPREETPFVPNAAQLAGQERADSALALALILENYRGMGDGRGEIDDAPFGLPPRSGKAHKVEISNAEACRKFLKEWRVITGRVKAKPRVVMSESRHYASRSRPVNRVNFKSDSGRSAHTFH